MLVQAIGGGAVLLALIAFIRLFLVRQIRDLTERVITLEEKYDHERSDKHKANNDVSRLVMALYLVQRLAEKCDCGVLSPIIQIIDGLFAELETLNHPARNPHETTTTTTTTTTPGD